MYKQYFVTLDLEAGGCERNKTEVNKIVDNTTEIADVQTVQCSLRRKREATEIKKILDDTTNIIDMQTVPCRVMIGVAGPDLDLFHLWYIPCSSRG